jgi:hypothetical protein
MRRRTRVAFVLIKLENGDAMQAYLRILNRPHEQLSAPTVIEHNATEN